MGIILLSDVSTERSLQTILVLSSQKETLDKASWVIYIVVDEETDYRKKRGKI